MTEDQKQEERVKAKQYAELMNEEYVDPYPESAPEQPIIQQINPDELSEAELLAIVNKRTGGTLASLDALKPQPTAEEIAQKEEARRAAMVAYGTSTNKFTQSEYDSYQQALANKISVVREDVKAQFTTDYPELSPEAIEEKVANYLFENLEPTDSMRVAREKELLTLSDFKINDKFKNIVNLPNDYAKHEEGLNKESNFQRKVEATLPVYTADVTKALQSLQHFTVEIPDTKNPANTVSVDLDYAENDLKEVADLLLTTDQVNRAVKEGLTFEQIQGAAKMVLVEKHLPRLISQAAKKYNATQKEGYLAARKGLLNNGADSIDVRNEDLKDKLDEVYDEMIASAPVK